VAAQLARHFEEGGVPAKAAAYRLQAGNRARHMSGHREAAVHLTRGLELLSGLAQGLERMQLELGLQAALGVVSVVNLGYASPQVEQAFARARELARACGIPLYEIPAVYGLSAYQLVRGDLNEAYEQARQLLGLAEQAGEVGYAIGALQVMGVASVHLGAMDRARRHLEEAVARYDPVRDRDLAYHIGHDPKVGALSYLAFILVYHGYPEQALAAREAATQLARQLNHPYTIDFAASFSAMLFHRLRWPAECKEEAERALELGTRGPYPIWQAIGEITHGWALAHLGQADDGIAELERGLALWERSGAGLALPYLRSVLAEACLISGRREEGLRAVDASFCNPAEAWWSAEQYRLRGELILLVAGHEAEAEAAFWHALQVAGQQRARMHELRAATSLVRLLWRQGRADEGRDLLADCYVWFTEGFDTPDLREARELLDER
jgi:tetratricopeptide (TPR) repeat protein